MLLKKFKLMKAGPSTPVPSGDGKQELLFRTQVLEAQGAEWLGALRVSQPLSASVIALCSALLACALIAFVLYGSYVKRARVAGITVPEGGSLSVVSPGPGTLIRAMVEEGQSVKAGQPLFELSTERRGTTGDITALVAHQIASRKESLNTETRTRSSQYLEKKRTLAARVKNLEAELAQLQQEWQLAKRRQSLGEVTLKKFETLEKDGFVSAVQTQQKQEEVLDMAAPLCQYNLRHLPD